MGVLKCDRRDCENIMCNRLSDKFGYICGDCFEELETSGIKTMKDIKSFMETSSSDSFRKVNIDEEFSKF